MPSAGTPTGFFLGGHAVAADIRSDENDDSEDASDNGLGVGIQLGYGFRNRLALFADLTGTSMSPEGGERYSLGHFDLGVRYHFASAGRPAVPYIDAAFTGRAAAQNDIEDPDTGERFDLELRGTAFSFGGGLQYFTSPRLAVNGALRFSVGAFDDVTVKQGGTSVTVNDLDFDATTTRFLLGVTWYPRAR